MHDKTVDLYKLDPLAISSARNATTKEGLPRKTPDDSRMTLRVAAKYLNMCTTKINNIESGTMDPRVGDLLKMAMVYNVNFFDFFTRENDVHV